MKQACSSLISTGPERDRATVRPCQTVSIGWSKLYSNETIDMTYVDGALFARQIGRWCDFVGSIGKLEGLFYCGARFDLAIVWNNLIQYTLVISSFHCTATLQVL